MHKSKYNSTSLFPYAEGYYSIFPKGLENRDIGEGTIVVEDDYIIYFKPDTPESIKVQLIKDYAEYYKNQVNSGIYSI